VSGLRHRLAVYRGVAAAGARTDERLTGVKAAAQAQREAESNEHTSDGDS
jgi:hypothetical protein